MSKPDWYEFKVGKPSDRRNWTEPDCQPLTSVAHVAHVPTSIRIAEDRRLRADLVFDKSKLNTKRIRVVWLSPNDWTRAGGFRYGNIRFHFDWATLVQGRRSYWVESIAYGVAACRILLTDTDYSSTLDVYDPKVGDGPWWESPLGKHYWNGNHCLEVMIEDDLNLALATNVDFVTHHANRCSIDASRCRYRDVNSDAGGAEFVAAMVSRQSSFNIPVVPGWAAVNLLLRSIVKTGGSRASGSVGRSDSSSRALARAVLAAYANPTINGDLSELAAQFASGDDLKGAVADAIAAAAGLSDGSAFLE